MQSKILTVNVTLCVLTLTTIMEYAVIVEYAVIMEYVAIVEYVARSFQEKGYVDQSSENTLTGFPRHSQRKVKHVLGGSAHGVPREHGGRIFLPRPI